MADLIKFLLSLLLQSMYNIVLISFLGNHTTSIHAVTNQEEFKEKYTLSKGVGGVNDTTGCWWDTSVSLIGCVAECQQSGIDQCVLVVATEDAFGWNCHLCPKITGERKLNKGVGFVAEIGDVLKKTLVPTLLNAKVSKFEYYQEIPTVFYSCPRITISFAYNYTAKALPTLTNNCQIYACASLLLKDQLWTVEDTANGHILHPVCKENEVDFYNTDCKGFTWTSNGGVNTNCLPTTCYKQVVSARAVYKGTMAVTVNGRQCQPWKDLTPHFHTWTANDLFLEDGKNVTAASNYCRDPSNSGYTWCHTMDRLKWWEKCDVNICD